LLAVSCALVGLSALPLPAGSAPAEISVKVQADGPAQPFSPLLGSNINLESIYGQLSDPDADPALSWVRETRAVGYARCPVWLGEGISRRKPAWQSGCQISMTRGERGPITAGWERLEKVIDILLASGIRPFIVCGGLPDTLCSSPVKRNDLGCAVNGPRDLSEYDELITQMLRRLIATYGAQEVRTWYFEVWSQPDHEGSWSGGRAAPFEGELSDDRIAPFLAVYDHFAGAAHKVDSRLRVGGPGLAGDRSFLRKFLVHCARGANLVTGKPGARLDFVSWHLYGAVQQALRTHRELKGILDQTGPELKSARLIVSGHELSGHGPNSHQEAAALVELTSSLLNEPRPVELLFRDSDLIDREFDGVRPLVSRLGQYSAPLPALRAMMLMAKLGRFRLPLVGEAGVGGLATRLDARGKDGNVRCLLYRTGAPESPHTPAPPAVRLSVAGLPPRQPLVAYRVYRVSATQNSPYDAWIAAGRPRPVPDPFARAQVGTTPFPTSQEVLSQPVISGTTHISLSLAAGETLLVAIGSDPPSDVDLGPRAARLRLAEDAFTAASQADQEKRHQQAVEQFQRLRDRYSDTFWADLAMLASALIYEEGLKMPEQAEAARRALLARPLDGFERLRVLQRLRVDAVRKGNSSDLEALTAEAMLLQARLSEWMGTSLPRYRGAPAGTR
jgi:hypothetical protein